MDDHDPRSLTGVWEGSYSFPHSYKPTAFTAVLVDVEARVHGKTREVCANGPPAGQSLTAGVTGERSGSIFSFLKAYDPAVGGYDVVTYLGQINATVTRIEGRWTVPGSWSGAFVMTRVRRPPEAAKAKTGETVSAD